jgi:histidyl-tRNA synthetase
MSKPSIPKGTRDFSPTEMMKRNYIFDVIQRSFRNYGFKQIETPSMENLATLTGKYGEEGDRLIFKILNRGEKLSSALKNIDASTSQGKIEHQLCNEALRYDLTVPFARYVVQHQNEISFPFKRYQLQSVWRADRPQKGRYREFYQCDADVVGSNSLNNEIEFISLIDEVFSDLQIKDFTIKVNNRKVLSGISEITGEKDKLIDLTVAIDKLEKIGEEKVVEELVSKGISASAIEQLKPILQIKGTFQEKITELKGVLASSEIGMAGLDEMQAVFSFFEKQALKNAKLELDMTLARGLNYYTGAIIEVVGEQGTSSLCGGGRYDDLTGIFGLKNISGVGISFGADRIYDLLEEKDLFPDLQVHTTQLLITNSGDNEQQMLVLASAFRREGIHTEFYPDASKFSKQLKYANANAIPYVIFDGKGNQPDSYELKDMHSGEQHFHSFNDIISLLKK